MAETLTREPAAPTDPAEETFEVDLESLDAPGDELEPEEGDEPEKPEAKAEPEKPHAEPEPKPEPKPEPVKAEAPRAEEQPAPERQPRLHPAVHEERAKRKEYARLYAEAREQLDAAEQRIRLLTAVPTADQSPALKKWQDELSEQADKATTMGEVLRLSMREMDRRDQQRVQELNAHLYGLKCDVAEMRARIRHPDWEEAVQKAGLFQAIATDAKGNFVDPALARRVYYTADGGLAPDPAERLYRLAVGKLEYERAQRGEPDGDEPKAEAKATPEPRGEAKPEAEAERRGAQRVIEQVSKNSTRPRGFRSVPKAGPGPTRVSRKSLDELLETNPAAYERLIARNPELERFHLG